MYCSNCRKNIPDGSTFCPYCGAPVEQAPMRTYNGNFDAPVPPRRNNSVIIGIIVAVAVVIVAIIAAFTFLTHGKQQAEIAQLQTQQAIAEAQKEQSQQNNLQAQNGNGAQNSEDSREAQNTDNAQSGTNTPDSSSDKTVNNYYYYGTGYASGSYYNDVKSDGYLWPTDSKYISYSDLSGYDSDTVAAIRNEIYARHGYAFQTARWQDYFSNKSWYHRDASCTQNSVESRLSKVEKANIDTIVNYEKDMGWK